MGFLADGVGLRNHGKLELVLDHPRHLDRLFQYGEVLMVELEEGYLFRDLIWDGEDGRVRLIGAHAGECRVDVSCVFNFVDVVLGLGLLGGDRQAGPYYALGIDWGDE
jgi:hypothetical protein